MFVWPVFLFLLSLTASAQPTFKDDVDDGSPPTIQPSVQLLTTSKPTLHMIDRNDNDVEKPVDVDPIDGKTPVDGEIPDNEKPPTWNEDGTREPDKNLTPS
jgi:hypothetical protein